MANDHMIHQLNVIEGYCEHVYAAKALLEQQIANGGGGSTATQDAEIRRLKSEVVTYTGIIAGQKITIDTLSSTSPPDLKKTAAEIVALKATVAQRDAQIQGLKTKETHTVTEFNKMKTAYEAHVADMTKQYNALVQQKDTDDNAWNNLVDVNKDLQAQLAALPGQSAALQGGAPPPPAGGNSIPAVYAPTIYPQVHQADALPQAAVVKQEGGGGGVMGMIGRWRGNGAASNTPAAPAGGALPGDAAAPPQSVQADSAARGRRAGGAGGAAAGGAVQGHVAAIASQFNVPPFADPMEMTITDMKKIFTVNPWNIDVDETSEITVFTSIITSDKYKSLVNQLASKYNIDAHISEAEKIRLLTNVYKLTRYIFDLDKDAFKTFVDNNHIVLKKQHNSQLKTAAALKSKTRSDVLTILKLPEVVAALQAMN